MTQAGGTPPRHSRIEFAGFRIDAKKRQFTTLDGTPITLHSRAFDTLWTLASRQGQLVLKQELLEIVWPGVVVEENNLNQAISALRRAFGDAVDRDSIIKTVPGRGYCFVADTRILEDNPPEHIVETTRLMFPRPLGRDWRKLVAVFALCAVVLTAVLLNPRDTVRLPVATPPQSALPVMPPGANDPLRGEPVPNSIAVLPFATDGLDPEKVYFGEGLHDEILTQLGRVSMLDVISRNTMVQYRNSAKTPAEIARELNVATILEGSVRSAGEELRITLQMTDPRTSMSLWSATYAADLDAMEGIFAIQADIAANVARTLQAELLPAEAEQLAMVPTNSPEAYKLFLEAAAALVPGDYPAALHLLQQAVETDPAFIAAWTELSMLHTLMTGIPEETPEEHFRQALEAAERALEINPDYAMAHVAMAAVRHNAGDWEKARVEYAQARGLGASLHTTPMYSLFQLSLADFEGGKETLQQNLVIDPINLISRGFLMLAHEFLHDSARSREEYARGEAMYANWWGDNTGLWLALGRRDTAYLDNAIENFPRYALHEVLDVYADPDLALAQLQRILRNEEDYKPGQLLNAAMFAAYYGDQQLTLDLLRDGLEDNWVSFYLIWLPVFDDLRQSRGFRQFLLESGLVDYWQHRGWPAVCRPLGTDDFRCDWTASSDPQEASVRRASYSEMP